MEVASAYVKEHNAEAAAVWQAFHAGNPIRPPVFLGTNTQFFIFNDDLNPNEAISFEKYSTDARTMFEFQLQAALWRAENIAPYCDDSIGLPDEFSVKVDLQNFDEAAYFGAPVVFLPGQVPDTRPILEGNRKYALFDQGLPDPLYGGWYRRAHEMYEQMQVLIKSQPTFSGRPIRLEPFGIYTCGILTVAHSLRGNALFTDFYDDPDYVHQLLKFITEATIARIRAHQRLFGLGELAPSLFFADDSIQLISTKLLKEFVLPLYKHLKASVTTAERVKIHLCGNAQRHFKLLRDEIGAYGFDTGFPIDFSTLRQELGEEVTIWGGPNVMLLRNGTEEETCKETLRILNSGICKGGKFILREGNNLPPYTPLKNLEAMYQAARSWSYSTNEIDFFRIGGEAQYSKK